jgi:fructan beta-fructosidase
MKLTIQPKINIYAIFTYLSIFAVICSYASVKDIKQITKEKEIILKSKYLNLPVQNGVSKQRMILIIDKKTVREFDIEVAVDKDDFWIFWDISVFKGKKVILKVEDMPESGRGFDKIYQDNKIKNESSIYKEKLRPQFHFSSKRGWNNDPNGLVYYDGEYHLFYQHNPYGWGWGNMHWGHAVSTDLLHWQELPDALYPDKFGTMFSGSAVIDSFNTSGFQTGDEKVMIAAYTADSREKEVQCIAYSNDKGRTWTKYKNNPVIGDRRDVVGSRNIRDPKVFWHNASQKWILVLFEGTGLSIFTSNNLIDWEYQSHTKGFWECPELFELTVDDNPYNKKWVMYGASGTYMIGIFDGKKFTMESGKHYNHNSVMYAAQTYNNVPDGRRIQIGWGRVSAPGMPFNQMMTFPTELSLRTTNSGIRLFSEPIREIYKLHVKENRWRNLEVNGQRFELPEIITDDLLHIRAEFEIKLVRRFGLNIHGYKIEYDMNYNLLNGSFLSPIKNKIHLEILVDRNSIEIFANHGRLFLAEEYNSVDQEKGVKFFSSGGVTLLKNLEIYKLKSIWGNK